MGEIKKKMNEDHNEGIEFDYGWLLKQLYGDCEVYQLYSGGLLVIHMAKQHL